MENIIKISPEQLYFYGMLLKAKYIDYAYVSAVQDIGEDSQFFFSSIHNSLIEAGMLIENFSGEVTVPEDIAMILTPMFFGECESQIDLFTRDEEDSFVSIRYHFYNGLITKTYTSDGLLNIKNVDVSDIETTIDNVLSRCSFDSTENKEIEATSVNLILDAKFSEVRQSSIVSAYIGAESSVYKESGENLECVSYDEVRSELLKVLLMGV